MPKKCGAQRLAQGGHEVTQRVELQCPGLFPYFLEPQSSSLGFPTEILKQVRPSFLPLGLSTSKSSSSTSGHTFLFRGDHLVTPGSSPRFEKLQKSNLKGGALGTCFPMRHTHTTHPAHTHTNRHTEGLELEFIAMLINCSESQLNLPVSFHRSLYIINTQ